MPVSSVSERLGDVALAPRQKPFLPRVSCVWGKFSDVCTGCSFPKRSPLLPGVGSVLGAFRVVCKAHLFPKPGQPVPRLALFWEHFVMFAVEGAHSPKKNSRSFKRWFFCRCLHGESSKIPRRQPPNMDLPRGRGQV